MYELYTESPFSREHLEAIVELLPRIRDATTDELLDALRPDPWTPLAPTS